MGPVFRIRPPSHSPASPSSEYPPDRITDAIAVRLAAQQARDGHWAKGIMPITRPPIEDGTLTTTAMAVRALASFAPPARRAETDERLARARSWLAAAKPRTTEDRNMQLLGLLWSGAPAESTCAARRGNHPERSEPDGGWAQSEHLTSDAYATGESLFALAEAGGVADDARRLSERGALSRCRPACGRLAVRQQPLTKVPAVLRRRLPTRARSVDFVDGNGVGARQR